MYIYLCACVCVCSVLLLVAVSHADALQTVSCFDGSRGLLHRQTVVDGLVALVVQSAVQHTLQSEVTVGLLMKVQEEGESGEEGGERRVEVKTESV